MVSLPASTSVYSPAAAELADALAALLEAAALSLLADALVALLADALPEADALAEEPPDEHPTRASAATTMAMAAKIMNFLVFIVIPLPFDLGFPTTRSLRACAYDSAKRPAMR